ncbi:PAS domain-containing protein [Aestuariivirga sp.]|uniref:PAS domain-containing protein n=1 Tax=Aestuariivirga sp. TaxID=2650926 RepID=UPI0025B95345|nr:PAS domain-containing protein [Aestuariivirga sp.]MCA3555812.1 PAS domain-containing protein [Aestuariivirga sp.]
MWVSGEARPSQEDLILHPGVRLLLGHWLALKGGRPAPSRGDLDLRQLRRQAPWLFILAPGSGPDRYIYRLAGTGICEFMRHEITGTGFLAGWGRVERAAILRALGDVTGKLQPAHFRIRYLTDRGQKIGADMLALPMTARDGEAVHVLGGIYPHGSPELWSHDRLAPCDLAAIRLFGGNTGDPESTSIAQAPRKFRLISGGLDRP